MAKNLGTTGHARKAEIGGVREQGRHQGPAVVRRRAYAQMSEAVGELVQPWTSARSSVILRRGSTARAAARLYPRLHFPVCEWG